MWTVFLAFCFLMEMDLCEGVCEKTTFVIGDNIVILSNNKVTASSAETECTSLGGHLADATDTQIYNRMKEEIDKKFSQQRVYMFSSSTNTAYKYSKSSNNTSGWTSTQNRIPPETLWYIDLYNNNAFGRGKVIFCQAGNNRWQVAVDDTVRPCGPHGDGWTVDFTLYSSSEVSGKTIYGYINDKTFSNRLTTNENNFYNNFQLHAISFKSIDIQRVYMFYNPSNALVYKYSKSPNEVSPWKSTRNKTDETVWFINLYTSQSPGMTSVTFCQFRQNKWLIAVGASSTRCGPSSTSWEFDFKLYSPSSGVKIYSYRNEVHGGWGSRLTKTQNDHLGKFQSLEISFYSEGYSSSTSNFFLGGNKTSPTCLQRAYNIDSKAIEDLKCTEQANYVCQLKFKPTIKTYQCNPSKLDIQVNSYAKLNLPLNFTVNGTTVAGYNYTIQNLTPKTFYNFNVTVQMSGCTSFTISKSVNFTTGYSLPQLTMANLTSNTNGQQPICAVYIPMDPLYEKQFKTTKYEVSLKSTINSTAYIYNVGSESMLNSVTLEIPTVHHGKGKNINVSIIAHAGNCTTPKSFDTKCKSKTGCSLSTKAITDSVISLSDSLMNLSGANNECLKLGAMLATSADQQFNKEFQLFMTNKYTQGLQTVSVFYKKANPSLYKYVKNPSDAGTDWMQSNTIPLIHLYKYLTPSRVPINFCNNSDVEWSIQVNSKCPTESSWGFTLYGESQLKNGLQTLYTDGKSLTKSATANFQIIFAPDVLVLMGGKSNANKKKLFQANTDPNACWQNAYHYENTWKLVNIPCSLNAYFACQVRVSIESNHTACNSTVLSVKIPNVFTKLLNMNNQSAAISINLSGPGVNKSISGKYNYTFTNLKSLTTYNISAQMSYSGCSQGIIKTTTAVTTLPGLPGMANNTKLLTSNPCRIQAKLDQKIDVYYNVTTISNQTVQSIKLNGTLQQNYTIPIEKHAAGSKITVKITPVSCEGSGPSFTLIGKCGGPSKPSPPPRTMPIVPIIGGIAGFVLLMVIVVVLLIRCRQNNKDRSTTLPLEGNFHTQIQTTTHETLNLDTNITTYEDMQNIYENTENCSTKPSKLKLMYTNKMADDMKLFRSEFKSLVASSKKNTQAKEIALLDINAPKNRYKNILPYDHARVILNERPKEENYINASFMAGYSVTNKFIASQGPKPNTVDDFWLMIWQQHVTIIVMLTKCKEKTKKKCEQYWPEVGSPAKSGNLMIETVEEASFGAIIKRKLKAFSIQNKTERIITQFQYKNWPDHGTPATTSTMIYLRKMVEEGYDGQFPIVVHCSAGVGRTGTYIAMDILFDELKHKSDPNVSKVVLKLRENRTDMVQTVDQYVYLHKLLVERESLPDTDKTSSDFQAMNEFNRSKVNTEEFDLLSTILKQTSEKYESFKVNVENNQKWEKGEATIVQDLGCSFNFIASKQADQRWPEMFWKVMLGYNVDIVVSLEKNKTDLIELAFEGNNIELDNLIITVGSKTRDDEITSTKLLLQQQRPQQAKDVQHILLENWTNTLVPPSAKTMLALIDMLQKLSQKGKRGRVLICCSNGCTRTGTFIALVNILERLKAQDKVDVFRTVKDLRDMRPNMVDNLNCYQYIYTVTMEYLASFGTYGNFK